MLRFTRLLAIGDQLTRPPFSLLTRDAVTGSTGSATTESGATKSATGEWRPVEKQHPQVSPKRNSTMKKQISLKRRVHAF